ncbi:bifunctional biotin--[acetyl-CoA-carboxylase] ligase/biotin operon repressor BirA [Pseudomonas sp. NPDC088444]|uniref:bifunctional biotin--[acetyl-CoA-carboxylase] ligase/biotin operon repressor BirA n=1 Tax=Pseudomonas sp. NPDC088444 TaxID=3364456 RepID=UPI00384FAFAF
MHSLLRLLSDGAFHSGEDLGNALGVSRSAVWKKLHQLQAETGIEIHKVRGRGYRLAQPLHLLDRAWLVERHKELGWVVRVHDSIDSTNAEAMRLAVVGEHIPALVVAEQQLAGRGRRGRRWVSPFAENLYYSLVLRIEGGMRQLEGLSLLVGLAVVKTLRALGVPNAGLKWPNDILSGGRKLAGVLLELTGDPADVCHVVIGIGINVNMRVAQDVDQAWTSMGLESGGDVDRNQVAALLSSELARHLAAHRQGGFEAFRDEWERLHLWQGEEVTLLAGSTALEGVVVGVDAVGALRLRVGREIRTFSGGELSLRLRKRLDPESRG